MERQLPITRTVREKVPVYPHLATLLRRNYNFFDFAATQEEQVRFLV